MVDKQKTFRYQLVMLHHILTKNIGARNLRRAIEDIVNHKINEKDLLNIEWEIYINKPTYKIFRDILMHSNMIDELYYRQVYQATGRRVVSRKEDESSNGFHIQLEPTVLRNLPYVKDTLLDLVCQLLASGIQDLALGKEANAEGKTGSTLEKMESIIREKVVNMNIETAKAYKKYEDAKLPQNQQRLFSSPTVPSVKTFSKTQLRDLAENMYNTSIALKSYNQLTYYLYSLRQEEVNMVNRELTGMTLNLHMLQSPYYTDNTAERKERRWKTFNPAIKHFYETELTTSSLTALAEVILEQFYSDRTNASKWGINLQIVSYGEKGIYNTKFRPPLEDAESWRKVNLVFDGFCLAHAFVGVLRANGHLIKLNPYIFLYDNVAYKFNTYDDLIKNSNDYVKLRVKFQKDMEKKDFMLPSQILSKPPEKLTSNFSPSMEQLLSWSKNPFTTIWALTGKEHSFTISSLVIRTGEGLHPAVVLFPNNEAEKKQDFKYFYSKGVPITRPPYNYDSDLFSIFVDSSQLSYYEEKGLDWAECFDSTWEEEFVSVSKEIVPNRYEYFAILLLIMRAYHQAIHHLNPASYNLKTTLEKAVKLKDSPISDLLWTLEQEDRASDVFFKLQDIVSDIKFSEEKVRALLETRGCGLSRTLKDWLNRCIQSLIYIRNVVYDAQVYAKEVKVHIVRPPVIDRTILYNYSLVASAASDPRVFAVNFPKDIWVWDEETTYGYLVRKETGEYKTKVFDGIKYFLHHSRIWVGGQGKVIPWQSVSRIMNSYQEESVQLIGQTAKYYLEVEEDD